MRVGGGAQRRRLNRTLCLQARRTGLRGARHRLHSRHSGSAGMNAPKLKLVAVDLFERPVRLRLPFRFGNATLREAPQMYVRARIKLADGREGDGVSAELLAPKCFDKSPELSNVQNFDQPPLSLATPPHNILP